MSPRKSGAAEVAKRASTFRWVVKKLFFEGGKTMPPTQRVAHAERILAKAEETLQYGETYPELSDLLAELRDDCNRAEGRMERFKRARRMA